MRLISHNKLVDINYDSVMIELEISQCGTGGQIIIRYPEFKVLGSYTKERALAVMEEIRKSYIGESQKVIVSELDDITQFPVQYFPVNHYFLMPKE